MSTLSPSVPPAIAFRGQSSTVAILSSFALASTVLAQGQFFPIPGESPEPGRNRNACVLSGNTGYSAVRVSGDGQVVATVVYRPGFSDGFIERRAARWTESTGTVPISPFLEGLYPVTGISSNGQVIYGDTWRWTAAGGYENLNPLFFSLTVYGINIFGCSDDGETVTGARARSPNPLEVDLFRWRINQGPLQVLPQVPGLPQGYFIFNSISGNGQVVAGSTQGPADSYQMAAVVINGTRASAVTPLGSQNQITDLSFDGSVAVGAITLSSGLRAFRWTAQAGVSEIDPNFIPGGQNFPRAVSADGSIVVGEYLANLGGANRAMIWVNGVGTDLVDYLIDRQGLAEALQGWTLLVATDVSSDGRTIVGEALNPTGCQQAFLVRLAPELAPSGCSPADIAGAGTAGSQPDGIVDGTDFIAFINSFAIGDTSIDALADIAGAGPSNDEPDGTIDGGDFIAFINAFAVGC